MEDDPNIFVDAAACGSFDEILELLSEKTQPPLADTVINAVDKDGRSALHYACLNDDVKLLRVLLKEPRVNFELRTPKQDTGIHLAALYACLEVLKVLFEEPRADPLWAAQNQYGETCLHLCAGSGDKSAAKAAMMILEQKPDLLLLKDKWDRGPFDVAHENGENQLVGVIQECLDGDPELKKKVETMRAQFVEDKAKKPAISVHAMSAQKNMFAQMGGLGLGGLKLKKVEVVEKTMFTKAEGTVSAGAQTDAKSTGKILSKLIDFPGDYEEIKRYLADDSVDAGGKDAYGLTALMKFASWNKTELMDLLLPHLSEEEINAVDCDGKTALHLSCEMASVAAVAKLVKIVDGSIKNKKAQTAQDIVDSGGKSSIITRLQKALKKED